MSVGFNLPFPGPSSLEDHGSYTRDNTDCESSSFGIPVDLTLKPGKLRLKIFVLGAFTRQKPAGHSCALSKPARRQDIHVARLVFCQPKTVQFEPPLTRKSPQTIIRAAQTYTHSPSDLALRDPRLMLEQIQDLAVERLTRRERRLRRRMGIGLHGYRTARELPCTVLFRFAIGAKPLFKFERLSRSRHPAGQSAG